jgi:hypothetical protein
MKKLMKLMMIPVTLILSGCASQTTASSSCDWGCREILAKGFYADTTVRPHSELRVYRRGEYTGVKVQGF